MLQSRWAAVAVASLAGFAAPLLARQDAPPTFRTATRVVEVPVVVTDRVGRPLDGLTRADFSVAEDGVPQAITFFEVSDTRRAAAPGPVPAVSRPLLAGAHTNHAAREFTGASLVVVLDRTNAAFDSQWFARRDLEKFLGRMQGGDRAALYVLDGAMRVLHDFTADAPSLRRALETYQARVSGEYAASIETPPEAPPAADAVPVWLADPTAAASEFFTRERWRSTFRSLQILARHLAGVHGRKSVVWVSEVFPIPTGFGRAEFLEEMRKTTRAMSDAQAALYPVDARGLVGAFTFSRGKAYRTTLGGVRGNIETMEILAEETGGRAYSNTNALDLSIAKAADDGRLVYLLGYESSNAQPDARFRRITVKVGRKGALVRHRHGYQALAPPTGRKERAAALRDALSGPLAATRIGLAADLDYAARPERLGIDLRIDPATLSLERRGGSWQGAVDVIVAQVSRAGMGSIVHTETVDLEISDDVREHVFREGVQVRFEVAVGPRPHQLRIVARDVASGDLGSLLIPGSAVAR